MRQTPHTPSQFGINKLTLSFPKDVEKAYQQAHYQQSLPQVRVALLLGVLFYAAFGLLDALIFPEVKYILWLIRFAIVVPIALLIYLFSFSKYYIKYVHISIAAVILLAGLGIVAMMVIAPAPVNSLYYAGLILIFIYGYTFFKIRFIWATLTGFLIVVAYEIAAIWLSETPLNVLLSNNFFFLGGNLIGMFACYSIETISREDFIQAYLLETEKDKVETLNRELEDRVERRTAQLVQANKDLRQEMADHREAEEKYLTLFKESKDAVFITTPGGTFLDLNPTGVELFGYSSKEEILKVDIARDMYVDPEDRNRYEELIQKQGHVKDFELRCKRKDGKQITVLETATAVRDKSGTIVAYQGIIRDITEKKELERQLFQSQKMESIGLLAGGIAHDLNNILAPITMSLQLMKERLPGDEDRKLLETLEANATRGADIVKQVLTFARGVEVEGTTIKPEKLIDEIASIVEHTFPKNIEVHVESADDLKPIKGNMTQLQQVLLNLSVNARDAMEDVGGRLTIKAENEIVDESFTRLCQDARAGGYVKISVIDNGTGMPPHVMEKVFEPFFTTKETGRGTGLGLSVILSIVKSHGGFIQVESEVGKGAAFMVYLPVDAEATTRQLEREQVGIPYGNHETILVVDDEESICILAREILENYNYRVITARDGREAVELYVGRQSEIKLVMTDMLMPEMDGLATIRALRELNPQVPIIATSGLATDEPILAAEVELSVQASLAKPYSAQTLLKTIHHVLKDQPG